MATRLNSTEKRRRLGQITCFVDIESTIDFSRKTIAGFVNIDDAREFIKNLTPGYTRPLGKYHLVNLAGEPLPLAD
jgi:hypothetical protein